MQFDEFGSDLTSKQEVFHELTSTSWVQLKRIKASSKLTLRIAVTKVSKHGLIILAMPSKLYTVDILISMDVHPNPGPPISDFNTDHLYFPPKLDSCCIDRINYSRSQLIIIIIIIISLFI